MPKPRSGDIPALLAQREASVKFGRIALQSSDLQSILTDACRLTGEALGTDLAKVMALEDDGRTLLVIAGVGWDDGIVGEERIPALRTSSEGFALSTGIPAHSEDISKEERFDYAEFLVQHGVKAMVNVIIPGPDGTPPYGLLQVDSLKKRKFAATDIEFLQGYANMVGAAIERHYYQKKLQEALATQERLLAELQHRIRNNLSVIMSLLRMKASRAAHPVSKRDIAEVMDQIDTLREIYDQLHASSNVDQVDLGGYLSALCANVANFRSDQNQVSIENDHVSVLVGPDLAVNLGLAVNEFVTNSLKHANSEGLRISTSLRVSDDFVRFKVSDNGPGLGAALEQKNERHTGSGLSLIEGLLQQSGCTWDWQGEPGCTLSIEIPIASNRVHQR